MIGRRNHIFSESDDKILSEINLVPLIDVMLVLLVTFMIAAPISLKFIKANIPQSAVANELKQDESMIMINIDKQGRLYLDKTEVSEKNLADSLESIFKFRSKKDLFIYADKTIPYGKIIAVMSAGKHAGVHRIAMLTKPLEVKNK